MAFKKRGNSSADSAAIFIIIIGAIIVAYILFISPSEREALLSGGDNQGGHYGSGGGYSGGGSIYGGVILLTERPGTISIPEGPEKEHSLPSTTVFTAVNTRSLKELDSFYIKSSMFSRKNGRIEFDADPTKADNFVLSFNVKKAKGTLTVVLNGRTVFNGKITETSPKPILLPKDDIVVGKNMLDFFVDNVGVAFWRKNEYAFENVMVSADMVDYSGATAEVHFTITHDEYTSMEKARLEFIPECDLTQAGRFSAYSDRNVVYSGLIDCGVLNKIDISKENLREGDNAIGFVSDKGAYLIDRAKVITEMKQQLLPTYYFNLPVQLYEEIRDGYAQVVFMMRFADYTSIKQGSVTINGFEQSFQTRDYVYQALLDPAILNAGPNSIVITPQGDSLSIAELRVEAR